MLATTPAAARRRTTHAAISRITRDSKFAPATALYYRQPASSSPDRPAGKLYRSFHFGVETKVFCAMGLKSFFARSIRWSLLPSEYVTKTTKTLPESICAMYEIDLALISLNAAGAPGR